jgi:hypothetical protein
MILNAPLYVTLYVTYIMGWIEGLLYIRDTMDPQFKEHKYIWGGLSSLTSVFVVIIWAYIRNLVYVLIGLTTMAILYSLYFPLLLNNDAFAIQNARIDFNDVWTNVKQVVGTSSLYSIKSIYFTIVIMLVIYVCMYSIEFIQVRLMKSRNIKYVFASNTEFLTHIMVCNLSIVTLLFLFS